MYAKIDRGWEGMVWGSTAHGRQNTDLGSKIGLTGIFLTESRNDYIDCDMVPIGGCAYTYPETIHAPTAEGGWRVFCFGTNE